MEKSYDMVIHLAEFWTDSHAHQPSFVYKRVD